jgi:hypothetical protein
LRNFRRRKTEDGRRKKRGGEWERGRMGEGEKGRKNLQPAGKITDMNRDK